MTQVEINKIKKRIARQQANQDKKFGTYTLGVKKAKNTNFSTNGYWKHNHVPMHSTHEIVLGGKIYKKVVR